jgi:formiminotetrahydrofolate cyclodeaminase
MSKLKDIIKESEKSLNNNVASLTSELQKTNMLLSMSVSINLMNKAVRIGAITDEEYFNFIKNNIDDILSVKGE